MDDNDYEAAMAKIARGADLRYANLSAASLSGSDLRGSLLCCSDLRCADLSGVYLRGSDLYGVVLRGVDLSGAILCGVDLNGIDLHGADLRNSDRIIGPTRSDGYQFTYCLSLNRVHAGCRCMSISAYKAHAETYDDEAKRRETLAILSSLELLIAARTHAV